MKKNILHIITAIILLIYSSGSLFAQSTIRVTVISGAGGTPVEGAAITLGGDLVGLTDAAGKLILGVPTGANTLAAIYNGETKSKDMTFASGDNWMNFWFDPPNLPSDFDGNYYHTVVIGTQTWMVENLLVTHFRDGTNIPNVTDATASMNLTTSCYCWYNNDFSTYKDTYGALYNWYAVGTGNLCPSGWHVPDHDDEWTILSNYVGGDVVAGGKLKETGFTHWNSPNEGATNEYGFTALPGGYGIGVSTHIGAQGKWWTATERPPDNAVNQVMFSTYQALTMGEQTKKYGASVRCIADSPTATISGTTTVCQDAPPPDITFTGVNGTAPFTFTYTINSGFDQTATTTSGNSVTVSAPTGTVGTYTYTLVSVQDAYSTEAQTGSATITVAPVNIITLTSVGSTISQTICTNTAITNITYATTGATGATFSGLPAGVTGAWAANIVTISGIPTNAGPFYYTVTLTGGCGTVTANGTITVNPLPSVPSVGAITQPTCNVPTGSLILSGLPADGTWTLTRNPGGTTTTGTGTSTTIFGLPAGTTNTYTVTDEAGCTSPASANVVIDPQPETPTATSTAATAVTLITATLNGAVNANSGSTIVTFEYGTSESYGNEIPATPGTVTGTDITTVNANITWLMANTTYHYRVKGESSGCTTYGDDLTFTTYNPDAIQDIDGNYYNIIAIGSQIWMAENLKTTLLNNGDPIQTRTDPAEWANLGSSVNRIPGYCWYDNEISNKQVYGALYNFWAANVDNLCPVGWHVPSGSEWFALMLTLDPDANPDMFIGPLSTIAGGKLKEAGTVHWLSPNDATNESGFTALPGGYRSNSGAFSLIGERGFFWLNDLQSRALFYNSSNVTGSEGSLPGGRSVRCLHDELTTPTLTTTAITNITQNTAQSGGTDINDGGSAITEKGVCWSTSPAPTTANDYTSDDTGTGTFTSTITGLNPGTTYYVRAYATNAVGTAYGNEISFTTSDSDIDGNSYSAVTIGSQVWMGENLKTTRCNDGTLIPNVTDQTNWDALSTPGYCWYNNDEGTYKNPYGALYNWHAVNTYKLCPTGWHVPTNDDWVTLATYLGGTSVAGGKLKETGTSHWSPTNTGATNDYNFTALPGGARFSIFSHIESYAYFWVSSAKFFDEYVSSTSTNAWRQQINYNATTLWKGNNSRALGLSVRCIKGAINLALSTTEVTSITQTSANSGGNIVYDGGSPVTDRGICWNTSPNPTISDNHISEGLGTGIFTTSLIGLTANTPYYVRAYATNSFGTFYGDEISFTTYKPDAFTDVEGNYYNQVIIGTQTWMGENLKTTRYSNGDIIGTIDPIVPTEYSFGSNPKYQWAYAYNEGNVLTYGRLYTWHAANDRRNVCPTDWHVPTDAEWTALSDNLGGESVASGKLREIGTTHWLSPNTGATDDYSFTALPGGWMCVVDGPFDVLHNAGFWWTATENAASQMNAYFRQMSTGGGLIGNYVSKGYGLSVRCLATPAIMVTNVADDGAGSLRDAITISNASADIPESIKFDIPGEGLHTIQLQSPLPTITDPVVIDGYAQPGASVTTSTMLIELDGTNAGTGSDGLTINTSNCTIAGLVINKFSGNGIQITGGTGNIISANSIYSNAGLGIELGSDGVTPNDSIFNEPDNRYEYDEDNGPNNLQNSPVLNKTVISLGEIYIDGHINSRPGKNYTLEFFASKLADDTGYGEGQTYLGSATATTADDGSALFTNLTFPYQTIFGDVITATATDPDGNTSEFSKAIGGLPDQQLSNTSLDYYVNPTGIPNIADENKIVNAVNDAFKTWTGITTANFTFNYVDVTDEQYAHIDGQNLVSFSDNEYLFGDGVLAITAKTLKLGPTDAETQILDADIIFNPYFVKHQLWNFGIADDLLNTGYFDIQSITTHEIGHILGLLHTGVHNSTMWFEMGQSTDARSLEQDDESWASYKYPEPGNNFGSISGHITYGYDPALTEPIAGALVLAINTATADTVHSYSDVNGNYHVPGLIAGSYNVYIEPLDGDVRGRPLYPRNISLYIYCNTTNFDYPGEYYSNDNESAEETEDIMTPVTVNAGSETSNINIVTNRDITNPTVVSVTPPDISISPDVIIKFSEPMDMATLIKENCYLIKSGETLHIGGSYTELEGETNAILFYPEEVLNYSTSYTLTITEDVTDLKGLPILETYEYSFTTGAGDTNPPTIIGIIPADEATGVLVDDKIVVSFSEAMDKLTVQNSFSISPDIGHTFAWDNENKTMTVTHLSSYTEGSTYNIGVSTGAEDMSGNAMLNNVSRSFSVVSAAPPTIAYLEPGQTLGSGITVKTPIVADFSEPINTNTVDETTFKLLKGEADGTPVTGTFEFLNENLRVVYRPGADLDFNQKYTVILTTGIQDVSQTPQNLQSEKIVSFTTEDKPSVPSIGFIDPPSDHVGAVVTIGGKGFDPDPSKNTVTFYNNVVTPVTSASLTSLSVNVPVGAESGIVHVKVNGVMEDALSPYDFLVIQPYSDPCNEARGSAQTGGNSRDVALDFSGSKAYVTNSGSNSVSVVDIASLTTVKTIPVGEYPLMIDIDPEGTRAYVTNFGSRTVSVIDLSTDEEIKKINVGINPYDVAVSPDGEHVFVANYSSPDVSVIDADPTSGGFDHVTSNIPTGTRNRKMDIDANSSMIIVTGDDGLKIIELIKTEFGFDYSTTNASSGTRTRDTKLITEAGLAVVSTMDGRLLFIGITKGTDTFGAVVANSSSGARAGQVQPDFSGVFLYVSNPYDNQVTVYKMTYGGSGSEIGSYNGFSIEEYWTIPTGISPQGMVINRLNNELLVVNELGETGSTGSVTAVKICCREKSSSDDIVDLALYVQGMINSGDIKATDGKMLIKKLNDAVSEITRGKTKTAINELNIFINKASSLKRTGKITKDLGQTLIDEAKAIIAKLKGSKSDQEEFDLSDTEQFTDIDLITKTGLGAIYPSPTKEAITIDYEIADDELNSDKVMIQIYDVGGRLVSNLINKNMEPGRYSTTWNGCYENRGTASRGIYYIRFTAGNVKEVKQIMLIR